MNNLSDKAKVKCQALMQRYGIKARLLTPNQELATIKGTYIRNDLSKPRDIRKHIASDDFKVQRTKTHCFYIKAGVVKGIKRLK